MEKIPLDNEDVFVEIIDLGPTSIPETIVKNDDGSYTICINARYSFEKQQESVRHAIRHLQHNDFEKESTQSVEFEAHQLPLARSRSLGKQSKRIVGECKRFECTYKPLAKQTKY